MATAKIATLAIRTLAKPIASQIKQQAQHHARFRAVCISLAQFMHRTEMALRTNLISSANASGESKPKVRPLNEAKAVTNGSNALAEGFLFCLAAALILGESYRGSRSRAKQRDRTEDGLDELRLITRTIAERIGLDWVDIEKRAREAEEVQHMMEDEENNPEEQNVRPSFAEVYRKEHEQIIKERDRLQHSVNVLLRLALKSGWIQGAEALHLEKILEGTDEHAQKDTSQQVPTSSPILTKVAQIQSSAPNTQTSNE